MDELLELYETMGISPAVYAYGERILDEADGPLCRRRPGRGA